MGTRKYDWTPDRNADLVRMRSVEHKTWEAIGEVLELSKTACHLRYTTTVPREEQVKLAANRKWSDEDAAELQRLRYDEKKTVKELAEIFHMTTGQISSKLERMRVPTRRLHFEKTTVRFHIPQRILDDRARRYAASHQDLTGAFFGDPLPGFSALDCSGATIALPQG
jgi:hypothetical protein